MGAVYDEDEDLDFSFLRQSVRQQTRGAAARRRTADDRGRDRMADMISGNRQERATTPYGRQGQVSGTYGGQGRHSGTYGKRNPVSGGQSRASGVPGQRSQASGRKRAQAAPQGSNRQYPSAQTEGRRPLTMQEKQRQAALLKKKKQRLRRQRQFLAVLLCILIGGSVFAVWQLGKMGTETGTETETGGETAPEMLAEGGGGNVVEGIVQGIPESQFNRHPSWTEDFLTISEYSRPGEPLPEVNNIFVHYTANVNTSAANNRNYFENLKDNHDVPGASAHFIIGIEGEILQIIPVDEMAYAVQSRNEDSISIECCYKYDNGQFTQETYDSLIKLLAWLTETYELEPDDILRHYDCGGKKCPLYYVDHEDAWRILKQDVAKEMASAQ